MQIYNKIEYAQHFTMYYGTKIYDNLYETICLLTGRHPYTTTSILIFILLSALILCPIQDSKYLSLTSSITYHVSNTIGSRNGIVSIDFFLNVTF